MVLALPDRHPVLFEHFVLGEEVRRTSFSVLHQAKNKQTGVQYIIEISLKERFNTPEQIRDYFSRVRAVIGLGHPNLLLPSQFGVTSTYAPFLAWPALDAVDLWGSLDNSSELASEFIATTFRKICDAMGIAWSAGLANCIIYPGDLLIGSADAEPLLGGFERILLYQGIPELPDIYYRAPELRIGDDGDERTLVYAVGCLIYEAVEAKPFGLSKKFLSYISERGKYKTLQWLQGLPYDCARGGNAGKGTGLQPVITKCLQLNPNQRYQDLVELKGELLHAVPAGVSFSF